MLVNWIALVTFWWVSTFLCLYQPWSNFKSTLLVIYAYKQCMLNWLRLIRFSFRRKLFGLPLEMYFRHFLFVINFIIVCGWYRSLLPKLGVGYKLLIKNLNLVGVVWCCCLSSQIIHVLNLEVLNEIWSSSLLRLALGFTYIHNIKKAFSVQKIFITSCSLFLLKRILGCHFVGIGKLYLLKNVLLVCITNLRN